jgi:uncharacterized protein (DUF362 family)
MNNQVYINEAKNIKYPDKNDNFSPSSCYPEYKFHNEISTSENRVYEMIRECLYNMGFDKEHFGLNSWNPLKEIIKPGDVVLIKPNMVLHKNENLNSGMDCLITHPSLVRAIIDYVVIVLNGKGKIIIGDAPMQSCDFEKLVDEQGYIGIIDFYKRMGIKVELADFRNYKTIKEHGILQKVTNKFDNEAVIVDLKNKSEFSNINKNSFNRLRITNYEHSVMYKHHNYDKNEYSISKEILEADVIINMPKPKTHRKAGVTISLKNLVGINTNKEWLPHHTEGSTEEGGDEYLSKSFFRKVTTFFTEKKNTYMALGMNRKAKVYSYVVSAFSLLNKIIDKNKYSEGSWYGNDTIWRTIMDLNKIIFFADKYGCMNNKRQRKMLIIADMIISGEGEGPLLPDSKKVGIIAFGLNPVCFDEAISTIMGFKYSLIPSINNARLIKNYAFVDTSETLIISNNPIYNLKRPGEVTYNDSLKFKPSMGWKEYFNK